MKKAFLLSLIFSLLAAVPAMADIVNSRHNLGSSGSYTYKTASGDTSEICIFCHTPHNAVKTYPLWNRSAPVTGTFDFYSSAYFNMMPSGARYGASFTTDSISLFCMSCHDGATGLFTQVVNKFGETAGSLPNDGTLGGYAAIAEDAFSLRNDHPVNFQYDSTADTYFNTISTAKFLGSVRFFGTNEDYVECASCHDPHLTTNGKFLRRANTSSNLCLACHNK